jgi:acyl-CoA synthetase (NDP forming)
MIRQSRIPIIVLSNTCIELTPFGRTVSDEANIHFVGGMEHGMTALEHALWWQQTYQQAAARLREPLDAVPPISVPEPPSGVWSEHIARNFLQTHGIPVVPGILATSAQEAAMAARTFGFPVALKVQASDILHKSDVGGVMLNISNEDEVRQGFHAILYNVSSRIHSQATDGVLVSPMRPAGIELLVGIMHDTSWGQTLVVGLGGIWAEVFNDTSVRVLPVRRDEIKTMLSELRGAALLRGVRGQPAVNIEVVADTIFHISQVAQGLQEHLDTLEINPLLLYGSSIEVLDVLITWKK